MITLQKHMAISFTGEEVEIKQWQVLDSGVLCAYLPHGPDSEILPLANFPWDRTDEVVSECFRQRPLFSDESSPIKPPQSHLKAVLDAIRAEKAALEEDEDDE